MLALGAAPVVKAADSGAPPVTVRMTEDGPVFATTQGMTLYTWPAEDTSPGKALCNSERLREGRDPFSNVVPLPNPDHRRTCAEKWIPLAASADARAQAPWSLVDRKEGAKQWAYEGHPLYASIRDHRPGEVNGYTYGRFGLGGWRVASAPLEIPPGLKLVRKPEGLVLATLDGRELYVRQGPAGECRQCAERLTRLLAAAVAQVRGDWSIMDPGDGRRQFAFKGKPLWVASDRAEEGAPGPGWAPAVWRPSAGHPPAFTTQFTIAGDVYTTRAGMGLYVFGCSTITQDQLSCDDPGDAAAYWSVLCGAAEACAKVWRLVRAPDNARPIGVWSVVDVAEPLFGDSKGNTFLPGEAPRTIKAWAWRGRPIYTFADDDTPGRLLGHARGTMLGSGFYAIVVEGAELPR